MPKALLFRVKLRLIFCASKRVETWLERAEKMLNFAKTAKRRFELEAIEAKRDILAALG